MKLSWHTMTVPDFPNEGEFLLYHTRTQAMIKIDSELKYLLDHLGEDEGLMEMYADELAVLRKMGIVVENEDEDIEKLKNHLAQLKHGVTKTLPLTILTTYACNFKCTYCFQESSRTTEKMSAETCDHVIRWTKERVEKLGYSELYLNFYGGEPLVNKPALEYIAGELKEWCTRRGVGFRFMMQTNGYLLTPECVEKYLKLGLDQVRISMDGVGEEHDCQRPLRNGGGTFDVIMKNIVANADKVKIGISVCYDKGNIEPMKRLIDHFETVGVLPKLGRFIFSPIHPTLGPKDDYQLVQNSSCMCNYDDQLLVDTNRRIMEHLQSKGLPTKNGMAVSTCPLTRENSGGTIDQHGKIYKCNSMLGHPDLACGDVRESTYNEKHAEFVNLDVWQQCPEDCTYLPMCAGGCRLSAFFKNKHFKTPTCHKNYLNKMAPELIKEDYRKAMAAKR